MKALTSGLVGGGISMEVLKAEALGLVKVLALIMVLVDEMVI